MMISFGGFMNIIISQADSNFEYVYVLACDDHAKTHSATQKVKILFPVNERNQH